MGETTMRFETVMPLRSTGENRALLIAMLRSSSGLLRQRRELVAFERHAAGAPASYRRFGEDPGARVLRRVAGTAEDDVRHVSTRKLSPVGPLLRPRLTSGSPLRALRR